MIVLLFSIGSDISVSFSYKDIYEKHMLCDLLGKQLVYDIYNPIRLILIRPLYQELISRMTILFDYMISEKSSLFMKSFIIESPDTLFDLIMIQQGLYHISWKKMINDNVLIRSSIIYKDYSITVWQEKHGLELRGIWFRP
jgi:hypothetical protein